MYLLCYVIKIYEDRGRNNPIKRRRRRRPRRTLSRVGGSFARVYRCCCCCCCARETNQNGTGALLCYILKSNIVLRTRNEGCKRKIIEISPQCRVTICFSDPFVNRQQRTRKSYALRDLFVLLTLYTI